MPPDPALPAPCGVDLEVMMAAAETDVWKSPGECGLTSGLRSGGVTTAAAAAAG